MKSNSQLSFEIHRILTLWKKIEYCLGKEKDTFESSNELKTHRELCKYCDFQGTRTGRARPNTKIEISYPCKFIELQFYGKISNIV